MFSATATPADSSPSAHSAPRCVLTPSVALSMEDRPGALGEVARRLGNARVNLTTAYLATNTRLVLAADNLAEAKAALS